MSYQVLALKYRPLLFEDIIAQEHVTKTLARAVETGRIAHGYLLTGPRGTGKTTTARILAKALNCIEGPTATPCNVCPMCKEITAGSSLDVLEVDAASNTGIDDIRTLRENIRYLPTSGKKRVFIIDEVHRLSGSAFDALLKTLEEPPEHAVFIFATTEPHKVPQTILSRTQRYDFRRVSTTDLVSHLQKLAKLENIEIEQEALFLIARKGDGSVRDSLSLFDQMIALADGTITASLTARTLGIVDRQLFSKLIDIIAAGKSEEIFNLVKILFESGADITEFVNDFVSYLRNLLVQKSTEQPENFLDVSAAEREALAKQATYFTEADILRMIQILSDLLRQLKNGYDEKTFLEICLIRLARMESSIALQEVIQRLNRLSASLGSGQAVPANNLFDAVQPPPLKAPVQKKTLSSDKQLPRQSTAPQEPPPVPPETETDYESGKPLNLPRVQMTWNNFLDELKKQKPMLASMMTMGQVTSVEDSNITIAFSSSYATNKQVVNKTESKTIIEEALRNFYKLTVSVKFTIDKTQKAQASAINTETESLAINADDLFAEDPELKSFVEQINGEIVGRKKIDDNNSNPGD
ncbi:MAG: DNA polymerase III subunit gamma/tau [candidate division Zixibacteria bacterium]|nr:DNA polymerase III subunit gamma/tau [candidate division Zixibacteria bacterium]